MASKPKNSSKKVSRAKVPVESMTGYGSSLVRTPIGSVGIDIRSVNARFLDLTVRSAGSPLGANEGDIREQIEAVLRRGRIECSVSIPTVAGSEVEMRFNAEGFRRAFSDLRGAKELHSRIDDDDLVELLLSRRELLDFSIVRNSRNEPVIRRALQRALDGACKQVLEMRRREGTRLVRDLTHLTKQIEGIAESLRKETQTIRQDARREIQRRLNELLSRNQSDAAQRLDSGRLEQEVALLVSRSDVHEELVRLSSHVAEFQRTLARGGELGKRLDFICQEMLRELNTVGSKISRAQAQHLVVDGKGLVEKLKEQVQNLV